MPYPETFDGFQSPRADEYLEFEKRSWEPRLFGDHDVDVEVECCGVCGTDLHFIGQQWGPCPYPLAVGHEIVGRVVRAGPRVTLASLGQRVGVGPQAYSCLQCRQCTDDNESYCREMHMTYGKPYPGTDKMMQGGFSSHVRVHEHWAHPIPDALASTNAAPMMCAGLSVFSPLKRFGAGPGKKIGVVGLGGLGHYAVMFAKALGAQVWVMSRSHAKEADALRMGADGFLATSDGSWSEPHRMTFDLIINTASSLDGFPMDEYLSLLAVHGRFNFVGLPGGRGFEVSAFSFLANGCCIGATITGSRKEMLEMLDLAASKGIKSWVTEIALSKEGLQQALEGLQNHTARYRSCMVAYDEAFGAA